MEIDNISKSVVDKPRKFHLISYTRQYISDDSFDTTTNTTNINDTKECTPK